MSAFIWIPLILLVGVSAFLILRARGVSRSTLKMLAAKGAQKVDVRTAAEYQRDHAEGTINIPLNRLPSRLAELDPGTPIILCCASGLRSAMATTMLKSKGFDAVNAGSWTCLKELSSSYALSLALPLPFDEALAKTRAALAAEGFGIPAEMDTQAIFKTKLGVDSERRIILGACLPQVAFEALKSEPEIALLLPCNVVVREVPGGSEVSAIKPTTLFTLTSHVDAAHADVVEAKLKAALKRLA